MTIFYIPNPNTLNLTTTLLTIKGLVHPKINILSLIIHPHVVSNPWDLRSSSEQKKWYFWWNLRAPRPSIDNKGAYTIKVQKCGKEIGKIIHVST